MVTIVAMVALVALVVVLFAPKVLRGMRSARDRHAGLIQAWIEYSSGIRTGQGQEQPSHHRYDDRSDFHGDLPTRKGVP
jgi:NADH:ubiquinone oxidoreductase subunit 3 (subunit A)